MRGGGGRGGGGGEGMSKSKEGEENTYETEYRGRRAEITCTLAPPPCWLELFTSRLLEVSMPQKNGKRPVYNQTSMTGIATHPC